ncbi:MAG: hypothetical protein C5B50_09750 [Verrucomicrobia bacterium]|nr:MAG: hypothetical protein C5B50_09750 [Verrucomicrobiota bacterium]
MSAPLSFLPAKRRRLSARQIIAIVLFTFSGPVLALDYWQNGGTITLLGAVPVPFLFTIACIGGAISFPLYVGSRGPLLAIVPGALAGFGAFGLHLLYTTWAQRDAMNTGESVLLAGLGASPGILACWALIKFLAPNDKIKHERGQAVEKFHSP